MPTFRYSALDGFGRKTAGSIAGASEQAVLAELESRSLVPVSIAEQKDGGGIVRRGVSSRQLGTTYVQLSDLLTAGVPLLRALRLLGRRRSKPRLAGVFKVLADAVAEGEEMADSMAKRPDVFPKVHIAMVRAGERGGFLEDVLAKLGDFVLREAELKGKIIGNLIYPCVLVSVGSIILGVIFGVFVPMFEESLQGVERLPLVSRVVFAASAAVTEYGLATLVIIGLFIGAWAYIRKRPDVRRAMTILRTRAPVVGPLVRALAAARFCRMLGTMLANGIPMLTAMQIARDAAGNVLLEEAIDAATESVRAGETLAGPLSGSELFGEEVVEMISVAESANNLDSVLVTIAETIERRVDRLLDTAVRLIEPVCLLSIAGIVAIVAAGLILPMLQMQA